MITYYDLGPDRKLNQIVMAGSHDAGITGGGSNVQTQDKDIAGQAAAGIRIFDLRIAAAAAGITDRGLKKVELRAFHADSKLMKNEIKPRVIGDTGKVAVVDRTKLRGGAFGEGLTGMLQQAKAFVEKNNTEFLILKFDKCTNWELIAEECVGTLGSTIYKGATNLNTTTLRALAGKVVCLFSLEGLWAISPDYRYGGGILGIKNLYNGGSYNPRNTGMQYFGKGGTSIWKPFGKIGQNEKKQAKLMAGGAGGDPEVMGMMYWTSTGMLESIKSRNDEMWNAKNRTKLQKLWKDGLGETVEMRIPPWVDPAAYAAGPVLKSFMPNMIMIDFADESKCADIFALNTVPTTELTKAAQG